MSARLTIDQISSRYGMLVFLFAILATCFALGIILDILEARVQHSSFYLSESVLFSFGWWLFLPLLYGQFVLADSSRTIGSNTLFVLIPLIIHLLAYPALVWIISDLFFDHTFSYWQTFNYGLTEYVFILLITYSVPFMLYSLFKRKLQLKQRYSDIIEHSKQNSFITTLVVSDFKGRTIIGTKDILFLSANPPYINIHHKTQLYLHNEALKAILSRLDQRLFVRVHKSAVVNVRMVQSYKSRRNGDYDLTIIDGTELRVSRIYAPQFKQRFEAAHRVTLE